MAQPDVEHRDAARLQQKRLGLLQRDDRPALLEGVPCLIDTDNAEDAAGDAEGIADLLVQALRRAPA